MAFATTVLDKQAAKSFGITFDLYNADTTDTITVSCSPSNAFGPTYQPSVLETSQPTFELRFGKPMSKLSDFTWSIANGPCQAGATISHDRLSDLFANGYSAISNKGSATAGLVKIRMLVLNGTTVETAEIWRGYITDCKWDLERVEFTAKHVVLRALEKIIPATALTLATYPEAPNESIGAPLPIVLGNWAVDAEDGIQTEAWNKNAELMGLASLDRILPCLCTDTNASDKSVGPIFHLAGHECLACPTHDSESVFIYIGGLQDYAVCDPGGFTITNAATETKVAFAADPTIHVCIRPDAADATDATATPLATLDKNTATRATIDSGHNPLCLTIPRPPDLGYIKSVTVYAFIYAASLSGIERLEVGLWDHSGSGAWYDSHSSVAAPAANTFETHAVTGVTLTHVDEFPGDLAMRVNIADVSTGSVQVGEVAMVVEFQPRMFPGIDPTGSQAHLWQPRIPPNSARSEQFPDFTATSSTVYMSATGVADTAGGIYTGTASALVERPCDIILYLAAAQAGLTPLSTGHGSFGTARTDIAAIGLTGRVFIDKQQVVGDLTSRLAEESLCGLMLNATTLGLVFWGSAASDNLYSIANGNQADSIDGADVMACEIGQTSLDEIRNAVYVQCGYHATLKKCKHMAYIDNAGSENGAGGIEAGDAALELLLAASETAYGRKELHLNCEHLRVANIHHIRDYYAAMLCEPRVTLRFTVPWKYYDLEVGHVIAIDDASWQALGLKYPGTTDGVAGYWAHGAETRYFWVERKTVMEHGTIEIEASEGVWS